MLGTWFICILLLLTLNVGFFFPFILSLHFSLERESGTALCVKDLKTFSILS